MYRIQNILTYLLVATIIISCATPRAPQGGPEDLTPPGIDSTKTTPNFQTNFSDRRIEITFDEWVKLNDVFNQVVVSPPLENDPEVTLRKKTVRFELDEEEVLRENTTYTVNFGEAVKDITKGNTAEDLRYVFSTGDEIDSLTVQGKITDLLTKEAAKDVLLMLYENTQDSVVRTLRPYYFAKTDDNGTFKIENIKAGKFKVFALKDGNLNYKFDQEGEAIGFLDSLITLPDSNLLSINLSIFTEETQLRLTDEEMVHYGLAKLVFNRDPYDLNLNFDNINPEPYVEIVKDSVKIWYSADDYFDVRMQADTSLQDTLRIPLKGKTEFLEQAKFVMLNTGINNRAVSKNPTVPIGIEMNYPIQSFDMTLIKVYEDTTRNLITPNIFLDSLDKRLLKIDFNWKENLQYEVEVMPTAMTSIFEIPNDTIIQKYKILPRADFGELSLQVDSLQENQTYIIQLLTTRKDVVKENTITGKNVFSTTYSTLKPDDYIVNVIEDRNGNGKWDTGNYDEKRKPERIFTQQIETLRPNWTVEAKVVVKF